jgi:hypothetical protein
MGFFDLFRRTEIASPAQLTRATGEAQPIDASSSSISASAERPESLVPSPESTPPSIPAPPAWSVLPPIGTVAQRSMEPSFDVGVATKLRTLRGPSDVFVSTSLSHTVNRKSSGVVDGLLTPSSAPVSFAPLQTDSEQVLRRQHPTSAELPALDAAHSRWPILSRLADVNSPLLASRTSSDALPLDLVGSLSHPTSSTGEQVSQRESGNGHGGRNDVEDLTFHSAFESQVSRSSSSNLLEPLALEKPSPPTNPTNKEFPRPFVDRSLSLVSGASALVTSLSRTSEPVMAAFSAPIVSRKPADPMANELSTLQRSTPPPQPSQTTVLRSTLSSPSMTANGLTGMARATTWSTSGNELAKQTVGEFTNLRRRSIIEMPSTNSSADNSESVESQNSSTEAVAPAPTPVASALLSRAVEPSRASDPVAAQIDVAVSTPTLGRKAGLGEPLAALPASAAHGLYNESKATDPFASANETYSHLTLARTSDSDGAAANSPTDSGSSRGEETTSFYFANSSATAVPVPTSIPPIGESGTPSLETYLRVVEADSPFEAPPIQADLPTGALADRPLVGSHSMVHRSVGDIGPGALGESSSYLTDLSQNRAAVPVQRLFASPSEKAISAMQTPTGGRANSSGSHGFEATVVNDPLTNQQNVDLGSNIFQRELRRLPDSESMVGNDVLEVSQPTLDSPPAAPVITRSDLRPLPQVSIARLPALGGPSASASSSTMARSMSQNTFDTPRQGTERNRGTSAVSFAGAPRGKLALIDRSVDRSTQGEGDPRLGESSQFGNSYMQRELANEFPNMEMPKTTESHRQQNFPGQNEVWPSSNASEPTNSSDEMQSEWKSSTEPKGSEQSAGAVTSGATATGSSAQAETDVEMLAGRIYDRIRNRLRRELLDDRERAGLTLDRVR